MKAETGTRHSLSALRNRENLHNSSQLFLIRLWPDDEGGKDGKEWRGKLQHVKSGEACDFSDFSMLLSNLQAMLPQIERAQAQDAASE